MINIDYCRGHRKISGHDRGGWNTIPTGTVAVVVAQKRDWPKQVTRSAERVVVCRQIVVLEVVIGRAGELAGGALGDLVEDNSADANTPIETRRRQRSMARLRQ